MTVNQDIISCLTKIHLIGLLLEDPRKQPIVKGTTAIAYSAVVDLQAHWEVTRYYSYCILCNIPISLYICVNDTAHEKFSFRDYWVCCATQLPVAPRSRPLGYGAWQHASGMSHLLAVAHVLVCQLVLRISHR